MGKSKNDPLQTMIYPAINLEKLTPKQRVDLGYMLEQGDDLFEQDYALAAAAYTSAALDGNIVAMNNLGWLYHRGLGVEADLEKAKEYYRMAADAGNTTAMINLGNIGEESGDYKLAYKWYKKAYSLGDIDGEYNYANLFHYGWYVEQDQEFAFKLFLHAASEGNAEACFYVGHYLQEGIAVEQDQEQAVEWFRRGAQKGDAVCTMELGRCYCLGLGVEKDLRIGFDYYMKAGELGDALAWANVCYAYETGQGMKKNLYLAQYYYKKGAELGEEHCIEALERLIPSGKNDREIFLGHVKDVDPDFEQPVAELMQFAEKLGLKTSYINGPLGVFSTKVFNIAPRNRASGEYFRLEHKISKLSSVKQISEKRVEELFIAYKDRFQLEDKSMSIKRGYIYMEGSLIKDSEKRSEYMKVLQEIMEDPLLVRENKKEFDELVLCDKSSTSIDIHVRASLTNGILTISGHDLGPYVEEFWNHEDYEYWYSFDKENTEMLIAAIHGEDNPAAALLREFSGERGCSKLRSLCDRKKIEYSFFSYP